MPRLYQYRDNARGRFLVVPEWDWSLHDIIGRPFRKRLHCAWRAPLLLSVEANDILEADRVLVEKRGIDPVKSPFVGCSIYEEERFDASQVGSTA